MSKSEHGHSENTLLLHVFSSFESVYLKIIDYFNPSDLVILDFYHVNSDDLVNLDNDHVYSNDFVNLDSNAQVNLA